MSCDGCRKKVEKTLNTVEGIQAEVTLNPPLATITMGEHVATEKFQDVLTEVGKYTIEMTSSSNALETPVKSCCSSQNKNSHVEHQHANKTTKSIDANTTGVYYCPMHCEGDKTYTKFGDCPVCGMDLVPAQTSNSQENKVYTDLLKKMLIAVVFTLPIFIISMSEMIPNNPLYNLMSVEKWNWVQLLFSIPVLFYAGAMFFIRAYKSIVTWNLNMFTLIGIGTGVAFIFSIAGMFFPDIFPAEFKSHHGTIHLYFEAATVIITLVLLGQLLEAKAHEQTSGAIKELMKLSPTEATLINNGTDITIAIDKIQKGDLLRVKPGDKIPVDGKITTGESSIDEAMITGEPIPVDKKTGDTVIAGTINGTKSFVMIAQKVGSETLLSQIIQMVNDASRSRAPIQKLADRVAKYFVPTVVAISLITFFAWAKFGPEPAYIYGLINAIAVLIIACPCALGLATPMSVMVGVGKGAQYGILIKNAEALENLNKIDVLITDKTGTITEGKPSVEKVYTEQNDVMNISEEMLIQSIASLNQHSEHPLAKAILNFAKLKNISIAAVSDFQSITGKGITGSIKDSKVALGNKKLMLDVGATISADIENKILDEQNQGKTVSYIAVNNIVLGYVTITDAIKENSIKAIKNLIDEGVEVIMLTGDNKNTAKAVADQLHLSSFKADCLPEDKLKEIQRLQAEGKIVAMAGDGINDAPALAQANIGIAMGTGTDVAIESAKITLVKGDLNGIVKAKKLSHAVMKNIRQNLFFAFIYNILGIPIAAGILYPVFGILLSPMLAALAMSLSSVSVIVNALRLRSLKL
ncbi:Cu2+-exporting ATPase [Flavobacterium hercynium]|nr:Cu2+-exporting ATPase [Flavobacterium hercynium]